jgi:phosphate starvation-inducible protein PhoH and related proteins
VPGVSAAADDRDLVFDPADNERLAVLCGPLDANLRQIEERLTVNIRRRSNRFQVGGARANQAVEVLKALYNRALHGGLEPQDVHLAIRESDMAAPAERPAQAPERAAGDELDVQTHRGRVRGRGANQLAYLRAIHKDDLTFGIGPAGTGKTYLAVACAVEALQTDRVRRIVLVRPAVEAGERLGFLPGDLTQKVDPYLRPMYDALYEMLGFDRVTRLIERAVIEVAPLAFMRGRTLNDSFVILDEAQNTTIEQMKMFLTRIGFGSKAVVTGDVTQTDLPNGRVSGLRHVVDVLAHVPGVSFVWFSSQDVVRHPLVQRIVQAYERDGSGT